MKRDFKLDVYLGLKEEGIKKTSKQAKEEAEMSYGKKDAKGELLYPDTVMDCEELYFDRETESVVIHGEVSAYGEKIGYLSHHIKMDSELLIEIIEHYMKKLGKLKTVMEAIK